MKNKLLSCALLLASCQAAHAEYIETVEVIATATAPIVVDPVTVATVSESLQPSMVFVPGGIGGFAGYGERGTQPNHTAVYRNGVPVNDAGAGWYDFGHDLSTGNELARVVSGPQGVLYGTSSMGGTVFLLDSINPGALVKTGTRGEVVSVSPTAHINLTYADIDNGSVRTDNTEADYYQQSAIRVQEGFLDDTVFVNASYQDYSYDYDDCYTSSWTSSNDCTQEGTRTSVSVRTENITLGYSSNQSDFFTEDALTYDTDAETFYADARKMLNTDLGVDVLVGTTLRKDNYIGKSQEVVEPYVLVSYDNTFDVGMRVTDGATVGRMGFRTGDFYITASSSYRVPTLYETYGDGVWVMENTGLDPEKGVGYEAGYKKLTVFRYEFSQGIDYDFGALGYVNTGEYVSQGARYSDTFEAFAGSLTVMLGHTDTERARMPEYMASVAYSKSFGQWQVNAQFAGQYSRGLDPISNTELSDVNTFDLFVTRSFDNHHFSVGIEDVFDNEIEIIPGYGAGGQQFTLTWHYR